MDVRAIVVGVIIGLIVMIVGIIVGRIRNWTWKLITVSAVTAIAIGIAIAFTIHTVAPPLVRVPDVSKMSKDEAEQKLVEAEFKVKSAPQWNSEIDEYMVIPGSQDPVPGTKVKRGITVTFIWSRGPRPEKKPEVTISDPTNGGTFQLVRYPDGTYHFTVSGISSGIADNPNLTLLLWVLPVNPPSDTPGWYLQRPPTNSIGSDGNWQETGQLGNVQWPPHDGDTFNIAVTVVDTQEADELLNEPGAVVRVDFPTYKAKEEINDIKVEL